MDTEKNPILYNNELFSKEEKDVFKTMTQKEHDDYTRELENKLEFLMVHLMDYDNGMTSEDIDELLLDVQKIRGNKR